jgi:hypothetical protein
MANNRMKTKDWRAVLEATLAVVVVGFSIMCARLGYTANSTPHVNASAGVVFEKYGPSGIYTDTAGKRRVVFFGRPTAIAWSPRG